MKNIITIVLTPVMFVVLIVMSIFNAPTTAWDIANEAANELQE